MKFTVKVGCFVLNPTGDKVLLLREKYRPEDEPKWNIIKGTCDRGKETLEACMHREIQEEANLTVTGLTLRQVFHYGTKEEPKILFLFTAIAESESAQLTTATVQRERNEEITTLKWFSSSAFADLPPTDWMGPYVGAFKPFEPPEKVQFSTT